MPQKENLTEDWKKELGEEWERIHEKYLHTIGNLTLTQYNSEYGCKPFLTKKDMTGGFSQSPLFLNSKLKQLNNWNENEIKNRAEELVNVAIEIWELPILSKEILNKYVPESKEEKTNYDLQDYGNLDEGMSMRLIYDKLSEKILSIDKSIRKEYKKLYIAYKTKTNFVDIIPWKNKLVLTLNIDFDKIKDPEKKCKDITGQGRWGNGKYKTSNFFNRRYTLCYKNDNTSI
jgi:predicted transport protein